MNIHATDIDIQEYALRSPEVPHPHITDCPLCREQAALYRKVFTALRETDVAPAVFLKLPAPARQTGWGWPLAACLTGAIACMIVFGLLYGFPHIESLVIALLGVGGGGIVVFLGVLQWQHYRKITRLIQKMQP